MPFEFWQWDIGNNIPPLSSIGCAWLVLGFSLHFHAASRFWNCKRNFKQELLLQLIWVLHWQVPVTTEIISSNISNSFTFDKLNDAAGLFENLSLRDLSYIVAFNIQSPYQLIKILFVVYYRLIEHRIEGWNYWFSTFSRSSFSVRCF